MRKLVAALIVFAAIGALVAWFVWARDADCNVPQPIGAKSVAGVNDTLSSALDPAAANAEEARVAQAAAHTVADSTAPLFTVRGRVVDSTRRPVAGASVDVRLDPAIPHVWTSAADGTFRGNFAPGERERATPTISWSMDMLDRTRDRTRYARVHATHGAELAGVRVVELPAVSDADRARTTRAPERDAWDVDLGTVVLLPATSVRVHVVAGDAPVANARVDVAWGRDPELLATVMTGADGVATLAPLPPGALRLDAAFGERRGYSRAVLPGDRDAHIDLSESRVIEVHVVDFFTGAPLAGAVATLSRDDLLAPDFDPERPWGDRSEVKKRYFPELECVAGDDGVLRVQLPAGTRKILNVRAAGYFGNGAASPKLERWESPYRLALRPIVTRFVRWPIVAGELPPPPAGTPLMLHFAHGGTSLRDERAPLETAYIADDHVVVEGVYGGFDRLIAETPDGAMTRLQASNKPMLGDELAEPVSFVRPRSLGVRVVDTAGNAVASASVRATDELGSPVSPWLHTDAEGRAALRGLWPAVVEVVACRSGERSLPAARSRADLAAGDANVELALAPTAIVRVRTLVDGRPALPARYAFSGGDHVIEELPELGELRVRVERVRPDGRKELALRAAGFLPQSQYVAIAPDGDEPLAVFELERTCRIVAEVRSPPGAELAIVADRRDDATGAWSAELSRGLIEPNAAHERFVLDGLRAGAYRVRDIETGFSTPEVVLGGASTEARVRLDLAAIGWVEGRVEVPAGAELARARVVVEGLPSRFDTTPWSRFEGREPSGRKLGANGTFRVAVPVDREIVLRAWHPWLVPSGDGGEVRVRGGRDGVVLALETRGEVRIPVTGLTKVSSLDVLRVAAFRGAVSRMPERWFHAPIVDGVARFAGLAPGRWTLWAELGGSASPPRTWTDVEIAEGVTELVPFLVERGSQVFVRARFPNDGSGSGFQISVVGVGVPLHERRAYPAGDGALVARGLAAGLHLLRIVKSDATSPPFERELELDGVHDVTVDIDLP